MTLEDFKSHFERVFFSEDSKRLDLHLLAKAHEEENEKYKEINKENEIFTTYLKRTYFTDSIVAFKKQSGLHPDVYKSNYLKNKLK